LAMLGACHGPDPGSEPAPPEGRAVRVAEVEVAASADGIRLPGVTRSVERADLAFFHPGHLAERLVERGERITAGDVLAVLHNPALMPGLAAAEARVRELRSRLDQLERDTSRVADLHRRELVSTDELDQVRSRRDAAREALDQARATRDEARQQLAEATLTAPFSGRVVELHAEPGEFVAAGRPVISLSADDRLEVAVSLPSRHAGHLNPGDRVRVSRVGQSLQSSGGVREIGLAAPGAPATMIVDLSEADHTAWQPGQSVHVELQWPDESRLTIPMAAIIDRGAGLSQVFAVRDNRVETVVVVPGEITAGRIAVEGGLEAGEQVVVAGHGQLLEGERVRILQ
ncbi:MAG: efflux RND transporter periplasmic adaptor subunit, partial [Wenzhouxiangella sp.]